MTAVAQYHLLTRPFTPQWPRPASPQRAPLPVPSVGPLSRNQNHLQLSRNQNHLQHNSALPPRGPLREPHRKPPATAEHALVAAMTDLHHLYLLTCSVPQPNTHSIYRSPQLMSPPRQFFHQILFVNVLFTLSCSNVAVVQISFRNSCR